MILSKQQRQTQKELIIITHHQKKSKTQRLASRDFRRLKSTDSCLISSQLLPLQQRGFLSSHKEMLFGLLLTPPDPACAHTAAQPRAGVRRTPAPFPGDPSTPPPGDPHCPGPAGCFASSSSRICIAAKGTEALSSKTQQPSAPLIDRSKFSFPYILNKKTTTQQTHVIKQSTAGLPQPSCHLRAPFEAGRFVPTAPMLQVLPGPQPLP